VVATANCVAINESNNI